MRTRVKICGITCLEDALVAAEAGTDAVGFIFWKGSPRHIEVADAVRIIAALPPFVTAVGVFVNEEPRVINGIVKAAALGAVQLHGDEGPETAAEVGSKVIKAVRVKGPEDIGGLDAFKVSAFLLDTYKEGTRGGTGETFDWDLAVRAKPLGHVILSGGLTPENVADAIGRVSPYAVDVGSGVEAEPGRKDHGKIKKFMENVKFMEKVRSR